MSLSEYWEESISKLGINDDSNIDVLDCPLTEEVNVEKGDSMIVRLLIGSKTYYEKKMEVDENMYINSVKVITIRNAFGIKNGYGLIFGEKK